MSGEGAMTDYGRWETTSQLSIQHILASWSYALLMNQTVTINNTMWTPESPGDHHALSVTHSTFLNLPCGCGCGMWYQCHRCGNNMGINVARIQTWLESVYYPVRKFFLSSR